MSYVKPRKPQFGGGRKDAPAVPITNALAQQSDAAMQLSTDQAMPALPCIQQPQLVAQQAVPQQVVQPVEYTNAQQLPGMQPGMAPLGQQQGYQAAQQHPVSGSMQPSMGQQVQPPGAQPSIQPYLMQTTLPGGPAPAAYHHTSFPGQTGVPTAAPHQIPGLAATAEPLFVQHAPMANVQGQAGMPGMAHVPQQAHSGPMPAGSGQLYAQQQPMAGMGNVLPVAAAQAPQATAVQHVVIPIHVEWYKDVRRCMTQARVNPNYLPDGQRFGLVVDHLAKHFAAKVQTTPEAMKQQIRQDLMNQQIWSGRFQPHVYDANRFLNQQQVQQLDADVLAETHLLYQRQQLLQQQQQPGMFQQQPYAAQGPLSSQGMPYATTAVPVHRVPGSGPLPGYNTLPPQQQLAPGGMPMAGSNPGVVQPIHASGQGTGPLSGPSYPPAAGSHPTQAANPSPHLRSAHRPASYASGSSHQGQPSPAAQSSPSHPLSIPARDVPVEQQLLPSSSITSLSFMCGALPPLQPGEARLAGLTLHPTLAAWYKQRAAEWQGQILNTFRRLGRVPADVQFKVNPQYEETVLALKGVSKDQGPETDVALEDFQSEVASVLGLAFGAEDIAQESQLRGVRAVAEDNGGDGTNRGRGLVAEKDLRKGDVLGVLGGYLLPGGLEEECLAAQQFDIKEKDLESKRLPPYAGGVAPRTEDWALDTRRYTFQVDLVDSSNNNTGTQPKLHSVTLWGLGYGNSGMLMNDPLHKWKLWVRDNKDKAPDQPKPEEAPEGAAKANVKVIVVEFRQQPLPILVCTTDVPEGTPLRRDYGLQWWRGYQKALMLANAARDADETPHILRELQDSKLPLPGAAAPAPASPAVPTNPTTAHLIPAAVTVPAVATAAPAAIPQSPTSPPLAAPVLGPADMDVSLPGGLPAAHRPVDGAAVLKQENGMKMEVKEEASVPLLAASPKPSAGTVVAPSTAPGSVAKAESNGARRRVDSSSGREQLDTHKDRERQRDKEKELARDKDRERERERERERDRGKDKDRRDKDSRERRDTERRDADRNGHGSRDGGRDRDRERDSKPSSAVKADAPARASTAAEAAKAERPSSRAPATVAPVLFPAEGTQPSASLLEEARRAYEAAPYLELPGLVSKDWQQSLAQPWYQGMLDAAAVTER